MHILGKGKKTQMQKGKLKQQIKVFFKLIVF